MSALIFEHAVIKLFNITSDEYMLNNQLSDL